MTTQRDSRSVALSYRLYRIGLRAYPRQFQRAYRDEVAQLFRDCCREAYRQHGARALLPLWGGALLDLSINVPKEALMALSRRGRPTTKPAQICSSCNNEVAPEWQKCIYCGEFLIPAATHDAPASGPWQGARGHNIVSTAVNLPWTQKD
jgi:hypothetical protein